MTEITIRYSRGDCIYYKSFEEIIELEDYHLIRYIVCRNCNLILLPDILPRLLEGLYCENNFIKELPKLPETLKDLRCCNNQLTSIPELPVMLEILYCNYNNLTQLPDLIYDMHLKFNIYQKDSPNYKYIEDSRVNKLFCNYNQITHLPKLPHGLSHLECHHNNIAEFPKLNELINYINISFNKLKKIPVDLSRLHYLNYLIYNNNEVTTSIPYLNENIDTLICNDNPISYFCYTLPDKMRFFDCMNTNIKSIPNIPKYLRKLYLDDELFENTKNKFPDFFNE